MADKEINQEHPRQGKQTRECRSNAHVQRPPSSDHQTGLNVPRLSAPPHAARKALL